MSAISTIKSAQGHDNTLLSLELHVHTKLYDNRLRENVEFRATSHGECQNHDRYVMLLMLANERCHMIYNGSKTIN